MADKIHLKLSGPYKIIKDEVVSKVIIPAFKGDMAILPDRAPLSVLLINGVLQILSADNKVLERYFIKGGVANIAKDICAISADKVLPYNKIDLNEIKAKRDEVPVQEYKDYYQMIIDTVELENR